MLIFEQMYSNNSRLIRILLHQNVKKLERLFSSGFWEFLLPQIAQIFADFQ